MIEMSRLSPPPNLASATAISESAFPGIYRRDKTSPAIDVQSTVNGDGIDSFVSMPVGGALMPQREKPHDDDRLAPMPENRRLGYLSVAALIINKMIGTGIFSTPGTVLTGTGSSKGAALFLWVLGSITTLTGLLIYLEFGMLLPYNGGEFIYLQESYTRPKYLVGCIFACLFVIVGNTAPNCLVFAEYIISAFNPDSSDDRLLKFVALVCITFICTLHIFSRKVGIVTNNALALYKVLFLVFVCIAGLAALGGARVGGRNGDPYGKENLNNSFHQQSKTTPYSYAKSLLSILYTFRGWENANYVLSEVKMPKGNPTKTFKRGVFFAFALVSLLYLLANVAYFAALTAGEIEDAGAKLASKFFSKVFGNGSFTTRGLPVFVAACAFGNLIATTYAHSRVEQEVARQKILPFSTYWARNSPYGTPVGALTFHWIFSVILILATPNRDPSEGSAYTLVTNLRAYGQAWIAAAVAIGLATLHLHSRWAEWKPLVLKTKSIVYCFVAFYVAFNIFIIVMIWYPPEKQGAINSYVTPGVSTALIGFGILYWVVFAKVTPALGYQIEDEEEELADGTRWVTYKRYKTGFAASFDRWWKSRSWSGHNQTMDQ